MQADMAGSHHRLSSSLSTMNVLLPMLLLKMFLLKERNVSHEKNAYERGGPGLSVYARQLRLLTVSIQRGRANTSTHSNDSFSHSHTATTVTYCATNRTACAFPRDLGGHGCQPSVHRRAELRHACHGDVYRDVPCHTEQFRWHSPVRLYEH